MKILELFSGTESFSKVARKRGHETATVDIDNKFNPLICKDIEDPSLLEDLKKYPKFDVIWSSPPCQKFSVMTIGRNWNIRAQER